MVDRLAIRGIGIGVIGAEITVYLSSSKVNMLEGDVSLEDPC